MENEAQPTATTNQNQAQTPISIKLTPKKNNLLKSFFIGIGLLLVGIIIGILSTRFLPQLETSDIEPEEENSVITPTIDSTKGWKTHRLEKLGIELKLPEYLSSLDYPNGNETKGEKGFQYCIEYINVDLTSIIIKNVYAGGGACLPQLFGLGTTSVDYEAGREGGFGDIQGYTIENGIYYAKFVLDKKIQISAKSISEITNPYGIKILRIIGEDSEGGPSAGNPIFGTPGKGRVGAIINLDNKVYSGLTISMKLEGKYNIDLFDQILNTLKLSSDSTSTTIIVSPTAITTPATKITPTSTQDWKQVQNNGVFFKIPSNATCNSESECTEVSYPNVYQGKNLPLPSRILVNVSDYLGGSRRTQYLENYEGVKDCKPIYVESIFGSVNALQIAVDGGWCQGGYHGAIVAVIGKRFVVIGPGLNYNESGVISRWDIRDTLVSTLSSK